MTKPSKKLNNNLVAKCNLNAAVSATKATETALNNFRNNKNPLKSKDLLSQLNDRMSEMKVSTINLNKSCKRHLNPELKNKIQGFCEALKSDKNPASLASKVVPRDGPMIKMGDSIRRTSKMIAEAIKDMMANFLPKNKPLARMKL